MKYLFFIFIIFLNFACSNNKSVYWCGDHACINNKEKEAYFKTTMIIEKRSLNNITYKNKSEVNKIIEQAKLNEKKRILNEKNLLSKEKLSRKKQIKSEKEFNKLSKKERKKEIKKEKNLAKLAKIEEKKRNKNEKKLSKKGFSFNKKKLNKNNKKNDTNSENNDFKQLVKSIIEKNSLKEYPDINMAPE